MTRKNKLLDTSNELQIYRFKNGIKLIKPNEMSSYDSIPFTLNTGHNLASISQLPLSFYLLNAEGKTQKMNEEGVVACGFDSVSDSLGKTLLDVSKKESAAPLIHNCHEVIHANEIKIFEEEYIRKDGIPQQFLSVKAPWYNQQDQVIGVCGFSIVLGKHSLAGSLSMLSELGMLNKDKKTESHTAITGKIIKGVQLSKRECECLYFTIKGYTAKKIARELAISHRTVEEYLTNVRIKLNASSKFELIEMATDYF